MPHLYHPQYGQNTNNLNFDLTGKQVWSYVKHRSSICLLFAAVILKNQNIKPQPTNKKDP